MAGESLAVTAPTVIVLETPAACGDATQVVEVFFI
jgi:hypothetical protein